MRRNKVILSLVMLFAYSIGVAHAMVPHCSQAETLIHHNETSGSHHHHPHHDHHENDDSSHKHVVHADHLDGGLLDFVICILSSSTHTDGEDHHHLHIGSSAHFNVTKTLTHKNGLPSLQVVLDELNMDSYNHGVYFDNSIIHSPPILANNPLRGPPSLS